MHDDDRAERIRRLQMQLAALGDPRAQTLTFDQFAEAAACQSPTDNARPAMAYPQSHKE